MSILKSIRAAFTEFRRNRILDGWDCYEVYTYPEQVRCGSIGILAFELGLRIRDAYKWSAYPADSLWRLTLDKDASGKHCMGVATCVSDDQLRDVIVLEPAK